MKGKALTYILGIAVVFVWGLIIYRVIDASSGSDDTVADNKNIVVNEAYNDFEIPKDTIRLLLNYRDPFALAKTPDSTDISVKKISRKGLKTVAASPVLDWGFIQYSGYIRNPVSKKVVSLLLINGQSIALKEGEGRNSVRLIKNMRDSIRVAYQGKTKVIRIKTSI